MLKTLGAVALAIALPAAAFAQAAQTAHSKPAQPNAQNCMNHSTTAGMGQMKMDHEQMSGMHMSGMNMSGMDHSKMGAMDHKKMMGSCADAPKAGATSDHEGLSR